MVGSVMSMKTELRRFRVLPGRMDLVNEWMHFLTSNLDAVIETLDGERIFVESIFGEHLDGADYLYWYVVQGEGGNNVRESDHWIDKKHIEYWDQCIDKAYDHVKLTSHATMIPNHIQEQMV